MPHACNDSTMLQTAVDLANTLRPIKGEDELETVQQLAAFLRAHPQAGAGGGVDWHDEKDAGERSHLNPSDLQEVRGLRQTVRGVLEQARVDPEAAAVQLNACLRRYEAVPVLRHDHGTWRTELAPASDCAPARLAVAILGALASIITTLGPTRLGVCAGKSCRATFVDLSRNGSKRYCTRTCAHRASVAAYRNRK